MALLFSYFFPACFIADVSVCVALWPPAPQYQLSALLFVCVLISLFMLIIIVLFVFFVFLLVNQSRTKGEGWSAANSSSLPVISLLAVPKCLFYFGSC